MPPLSASEAAGSWLAQPSWADFIFHLERNVDVLTTPEAADYILHAQSQPGSNNPLRPRPALALELTRVARDDGVGHVRDFMIAQLTPYLEHVDPTVRLDSALNLLALVPPGTPEWRELLAELLRQVLIPGGNTVETTLHFLESTVAGEVNSKSVGCSPFETALGELYMLRQTGERAAHVAIALDWFGRAVASARAADADVDEAAALKGLGSAQALAVVQDRKTSLGAALETFARAQELRQHLSEVDRGDLDLAHGWAVAELSRLTIDNEARRALVTEAVTRFEQAAHAGLPMGAVARVNEAWAKALLAEFDPTLRDVALRLHREALRAFDTDPESYNWGWARTRFLHSCFALGDPYRLDEMEDLARSAVRAFADMSLSAEHAEASMFLGDVLLMKRQWQPALEIFEELIGVQEAALSQASSMPDRESGATILATVTGNASYCLARLGRLQDAVNTLERGKMRTGLSALALQVLARSSAASEVGQLLTDLAKLEDESRRAGRLQSKTGDSRVAGVDRRGDGELTVHLAEVRRRLARLVDQTDLTGVDQSVEEALRDRLATDAAIVHLATTRVGTVSLLTQAGDQRSFRQKADFLEFNLDDLTEIAGQYVLFLEARNDWTLRLDAAARRELLANVVTDLGKRVGAPLIRLLHDHAVAEDARVTLVGSSGLSSLPVHASGEASAMLELFDVEAVPSVLVMQTVKRAWPERKIASRNVVHVVDPNENLPFTRVESSLFDRIDPGPSTVLIGEAAKRKPVMRAMETGRVAHFACHGAFTPTAPWASRLLLSNGDLLAAEVVRTNLSAVETVLLSACETGVEDIRRAPEEHAGLRSAFLMAGANSVVSTLWAVNDISTALIVYKCQQLALRHHRPHARTVRSAQLWLRNASAHDLGVLAKRERQNYSLFSGQQRGVRKSLKQFERSMARLPDERKPFEHPYYWAPFVSWSTAIDPDQARHVARSSPITPDRPST